MQATTMSTMAGWQWIRRRRVRSMGGRVGKIRTMRTTMVMATAMAATMTTMSSHVKMTTMDGDEDGG